MAPGSPRRLSDAIGAVRRASAPRTLLASVQIVWADAVGDRIAAVAQPASERDGRVTVVCESAVWAHELDLMQNQLLASLAERMDSPPQVLRFTVGEIMS